MRRTIAIALYLPAGKLACHIDIRIGASVAMRINSVFLGSALCLVAGPALAASWTVQAIASSEPGNKGRLTYIDGFNGVPALNDAGDVAFAAAGRVKHTAVGGAWLSKGGKTPKLLATTQPDDIALQAAINRSGGVSFSDVVSTGAQTTTIIRVEHGTVTVVPRFTQARRFPRY